MKTKRKSPCSVRPPEVRFWEKVNKIDGGCWVWIGARIPKGYGRFTVGVGRSVACHRYSWTLANGAIPDGMFVCHACDNPECVNPDHLFLGTPSDNTRDMVSKGRHSRGASHGDKVRKASGRFRKLSNDAVLGIKRCLRNGMKQRDIAKEFGVCQRTVAMIFHGITWSHVNE